jgi:hypothetical protein
MTKASLMLEISPIPLSTPFSRKINSPVVSGMIILVKLISRALLKSIRIQQPSPRKKNFTFSGIFSYGYKGSDFERVFF